MPRCSTISLGMPQSSVIRFRCDSDLSQRFERVALLRRRKGSDLARLWFEDMIQLEEQRLGISLSGSALHDSVSSDPARIAAGQVMAAGAALAGVPIPSAPAATARTTYATPRRPKSKQRP